MDHPPNRRLVCARCLRPRATCLCALARPTAHLTQVLVLQHPQEQGQAKNSVALLRLSLSSCEVVVGERFAPQTLAGLLHRPGRDTCLLYPNVPAAPAASLWPVSSAPERDVALPMRLVVIDATWRKSLKMLLEHPPLAALPRLSLTSPPPTHYRQIRAARRPDQISTLEATVQALARLEGPRFEAEPLLKAFADFVAQVASQKEPSPRDRPLSKVNVQGQRAEKLTGQALDCGHFLPEERPVEVADAVRAFASARSRMDPQP